MITALLIIAQFQAFTLVSADSVGPGQMLRVTSPGTDTLQVYVEHLGPHEAPNRKAAKGADRVAWCYPRSTATIATLWATRRGESLCYRGTVWLRL
jgi:hypothetical protein